MPDWYSHSIWTSKSSTSVNGIAPTWIVIVDALVRPQLVPTILTLYVPAFAVDGTLIVAVVLLAVQPNRLVSAKMADQPAGTSLKLSRTRSKKLELRLTVTGIAIEAPVNGAGYAAVGATTRNVPRAATRCTSSSGSWKLSGSVEVFQLKLPR